MSKGQTIRLFLVDGSPGGMWIAEIMGRTIRAIVAPLNTSKFNDLFKRPEVQKAGVYILARIDPEDPLQQRIYIGQSENVLQRLRQHANREWERVIIFSSTDANLTKSHVLYLESRLINLAKSSGRAKIENDNITKIPALPEADQSYMEEWMDWVKLLLPVLGYNFAASELDKPYKPSLKLYMNKVGVNAKLYQINDEWIIIKGSTARRDVTNSLPASLSKLRDSLVADGILVTDETNAGYLKFTKNYPATSLSMAATLIAGTPYNGTEAWEVEGTGEAYSKWREKQLNEAEKQMPLIAED